MSIIINFFIVFAFVFMYMIAGTAFLALIWKRLKSNGAEDPAPYIAFWPFILLLLILEYAASAAKWLSGRLHGGGKSGDTVGKE